MAKQPACQAKPHLPVQPQVVGKWALQLNPAGPDGSHPAHWQAMGAVEAPASALPPLKLARQHSAAMLLPLVFLLLLIPLALFFGPPPGGKTDVVGLVVHVCRWKAGVKRRQVGRLHS